jgi:hypothetical protein
MLKRSSLFATLAMGIASQAFAIPALQLDIAGGSYDNATETVVTNSNTFSLYALLSPSNSAPSYDRYYVSFSVTPATSTASNFGYFLLNGNRIDVTADMVFGVPPFEANLNSDPGDLSRHSIFPTYFYEYGFYFNNGNRTSAYNVEDEAGRGLVGSGTMLYKTFNIDASHLADGTGLHMDLYSENYRYGDVDIDQFAPFSHDAEFINTSTPEAVPEPTTLGLMGLGLAGLAMAARRRRV